MKRAMKSIETAVIAAALIFTVTSCNGENNIVSDSDSNAQVSTGTSSIATSDTSKHMEISLGYWDCESAFAGGDSDYVLKTIQDKLNITLVPVNVSWDDYTQKYQVWASSGSLPDVFASDMRNTANFAKWANEKVIRAIPRDLSAYPNLQNYLEGNPETDTCKIGEDIYCIFRQTYLEQAGTINDRHICYRWDLAQKAGIKEEPKTWDEFRTMMKAIIAADPEQKNIQGMTTLTPDHPVGVFLTYSVPLATTGGNVFKWVDKGDGTYVPAYFAGENLGDDALATWELVRGMYEEGTIEPDIALATTEQGYNKFLNGQAAALLPTGPAGPYSDVAQYWKEVHGREYTDDVKVLDLMPSVDGKKYYWTWDYAWSESFFSAKVDDEKMDRIMKLYDYLLSEEGLLLGRYGVENETYVIEEGKYIVPGTDAEGDRPAPTTVYPSINVFHDLVAWTPPFPNGMEQKDKMNDLEKALMKLNDDRFEEAKSIQLPEYDARYTQIFVSLNTEFGLNLKDDMISIMTGTEPVEKMWSDIIQSYKDKGLDEIIEQVNKKARELGYQK